MLLAVSILLFIQIDLSFTNKNVILNKSPTVFISVLVRNKEHTLPYFLTCLRNLDYPKDRIYLWFHSDYNQDGSIALLEQWKNKHEHEYNKINLIANSTAPFLHSDESAPSHWSRMHFKHVMQLREKALNYARKRWADYIFMLDADIFLTNPVTLLKLIEKDENIVAPLLLSDGMYSNFWCGMSKTYYYERTEDYEPILKRRKVGCFQVPMVHSAVLIDLRTIKSERLTYLKGNVINYEGPEDDIIVFAIAAKHNGINLTICNDVQYGFLPVPLDDGQELEHDYEQMLNVKLEAISRGSPLPLDPDMVGRVIYPDKWKFVCDEIYLINLERRTERLNLMIKSFDELGMDVKVFKAVDGRDLNMNLLNEYSIKLMPGYEDPYHKRPMKAGEVGCFLSHYYIWEEIVQKNQNMTLVLEDDIHFVPYFRSKLLNLLLEIGPLDWDLTYIGRKLLNYEDEVFVSTHVVKPQYSYWTLGYLITLEGAKKLINAKPLSKMLPVDEYLPIMFDQHPNTTWKSYFPNRNLKAYSASPLLVHPTHYTGEEGYISDTEDSTVVHIDSNFIKEDL